MADGGDPNLVIAQRLQERFEFYLTGLAFTVLGLSVQTAKLEGPACQIGFELFGWASLFVSGLAGFHRAERSPSLYRIGSALENEQQRVARLQGGASQGHDTVILPDGKSHPIKDEIAESAAAVKRVQELFDGYNRKLQFVYRIQRGALIVGFGSLLLSRGYSPLSRAVASIIEVVVVGCRH